MTAFRRILLLLLSILVLTGAPASAQTITQVVFFGDSLSDSGNHFILTHNSSRQPFSLEPPTDPYDIGGHHYSNGNTWAEQLATALHLPTAGNPSFRAPGLFTNYAVGQARARAGSIPGVDIDDIDVGSQVGRYLADVGGRVPSGTLVAIWIGSNDVSDAIAALVADPSGNTSAGILNDAFAATSGAINALFLAGARMFLIVNVPDPAHTPYVRFLDATQFPGIAGAATVVTTQYNGALSQLVGGLKALPGMQFVELLDANALVAQIIALPASFGIANATDRCTTPNAVGGAICASPFTYLFWDATHPTRTGHAVVAEAALQLLPPQ